MRCPLTMLDSMPRPDIFGLPAFDSDSGAVNTIIETPQGRRMKFKYDLEAGVFKFDKNMPVGFAFPFDFGFIPSTLGEDGDPLDIMILADQPTFVGCLILTRLLGVLEAKQSDQETTVRNDRLIGIPLTAKKHEPAALVTRLEGKIAADIQEFFVLYNQAQGRTFEPLGIHGPDRATALIRQCMARARKKAHSNGKRKARA